MKFTGAAGNRADFSKLQLILLLFTSYPFIPPGISHFPTVFPKDKRQQRQHH